jgi:cytochrome P450
MTTTTIDPTLLSQIVDPSARPDPYALFGALRQGPVSWQETPTGGAYVVSRYQDVLAAMQDPRISSDRRKDPEMAAKDRFARSGRAPMFQQLDPPEHDVMRAKTMRHFGPPHRPSYVEDLHRSIDGLAEQIVDDLGGHGEIDVVTELAYKLPIAVICQVLGVPPEDEPKFSHWVDQTMNADSSPEDAEEGIGALGRYLGGLMAQRRTEPRDDLLSRMVSEHGPGPADSADGPWDPQTLITTAMALLVAGHETTVNLITNGVLMMLRRPELIEDLRANRGLIVPLVEEVMRFDPPAPLIPDRVVLDDIRLGGVTIPRGSAVTLAIAAANRDPAQFPDPDTFRLDRTENAHLGFGNGVHYCFGAPLARLEGQAALRSFLLRVENPRLLQDPPPYRSSPTLRGPSELHVAFDGISDA